MVKTADECVSQIMRYPYRRVNRGHEGSRPCTMCGRLGTTVEVLMNDSPQRDDEINANDMAHFGERCWRKIRGRIAANLPAVNF